MKKSQWRQFPFGGWHHANDHGWLFKRSPRFTDGIHREAGSFLTTPFTEGRGGVNHQTLPPGRSNVLHFQPLCVQFSSVQFSSVPGHDRGQSQRVRDCLTGLCV